MHVPIQEISRIVSPSFAKKRFLLILTFYCDESYDSDPRQRKGAEAGKRHVPETFVVGGFVAEERIWKKIERRWANCNKAFGVSRFHAVEVNARSGEFEGWSDSKRNRYSKRLLGILADQDVKLCAVSAGINSREYEDTVDLDARQKWGTPYLVAFKTCVAYIAQLMAELPNDIRLAVVLSRCEFQNEALEAFEIMKSMSHWRDSRRLVTCTPADPKDIIPLETADLIAYETFRLMHAHQKQSSNVRHALNILFPRNVLLNHLWHKDNLHGKSEAIRGKQIGPNGLIHVFPDDDPGVRKNLFITSKAAAAR